MMKTERSPIITFSVVNFIGVSITWLLFVFLPVYFRHDLGFPEGRVGVLISIHAYTMLLALVPLGYLSDRISPRRLLQAGVLGRALYLLGISQVHGYTWLKPLQVLGGASEAFGVICLTALYYKSIGAQGRGRSVGVFSAAGFLGFAAGPWIKASLGMLGFSYQQVFLFAMIVSVGLFFITALLKDSKPVPFHALEYVRDLRRPEVLIMAAVMIGIGIHFGVERKSFSLLLTRGVGLDAGDMAWLFTILGVCNGASTYLIGRWFDRSKRMLYFMVLGVILSGTLQALTPYARSFGSVAAIRTVHLLGDAIVLFGLNVLTASIFPQHRMGGNSGFLFLLRTTGTVIGATAAGLFDVRWPSYKASFLFSGLAVIIAGISLVIGIGVMRRLRRSLTEEAERTSRVMPQAELPIEDL